METSIPRTTVEHESKTQLLNNHSRTSERQGYEADKERQEKEGREGLTVRDKNKNSMKAIAIPPVRGGVGRESVDGKAQG